MGEWDDAGGLANMKFTIMDVESTNIDAVEARLRAAESLGYEVTRNTVEKKEHVSTRPPSYDNWLLERKVRFRNDWDDEDVGDSCCFGTRTVDMGMDCIWRLHGGV